MLIFTVSIEASKDGVKFTCNGDIGSGSVTIRQHTNVDKPDLDVSIDLTEPVALTFSLKYLVNFCKASGLSSKVRLCLSQEVPLLVEYGLAGSGHLRFYLAPKVCHLHFTFDKICQANAVNRLEMTSKRWYESSTTELGLVCLDVVSVSLSRRWIAVQSRCFSIPWLKESNVHSWMMLLR